MKHINWIVACMALLGASCTVAPQRITQDGSQYCRQPLNMDLYSGDLASALAKTNRCIEINRAMLAAQAKDNFLTKGQTAQTEGPLAHFLYVKIQILTLQGALPEAKEALKDADLFDQTHPEVGMTEVINSSALLITRAFLLEKSGDLKGAYAAYEDIFSGTKAKGFDFCITNLCGRLAVIALENGDEAAAERWSRQASADDAAAKAVMGTLLQKRGDKAGARAQYQAAQKLLKGTALSEAASRPIAFAEQKRITDGLAQTIK